MSLSTVSIPFALCWYLAPDTPQRRGGHGGKLGRAGAAASYLRKTHRECETTERRGERKGEKERGRRGGQRAVASAAGAQARGLSDERHPKALGPGQCMPTDRSTARSRSCATRASQRSAGLRGCRGQRRGAASVQWRAVMVATGHVRKMHRKARSLATKTAGAGRRSRAASSSRWSIKHGVPRGAALLPSRPHPSACRSRWSPARCRAE